MKNGTLFSLPVLAAMMSGCAVTTVGVAEKATEATATIEAAREKASSPTLNAPTPGLRRMTGNFLGSQPIHVSHATGLPSHLRNVTFAFGPGGGTLETVARNVRMVTGLTIRINADVEEQAPVPSLATPLVIGPNTETSAVPLPGAPLTSFPSQGRIERTGVPSGPIPLSFTGDLTDYFDNIAATLGINWEYVNGEVKFFRLLTKTFQLSVSPGTLGYKDEVTSGGSGGSGTSATAGSFASSTTASVDAQMAPWQGVENAIKTMLTPAGKSYVNMASGAIVITDTKESVDRIGRYIESENDLLNRQVRIELREILVEDTGSSSAGLDINLIYNRFRDAGLSVDGLTTNSPNYNIASTAPRTLVDAATGTMTLNVTNSASYFAGSSIAAQALNGVGKVVSDSTRSVITTNRTPGRLQDVTDRAYLAETKPASGGALDGGSGVPGLTPGVVTYGDNVTVVPTVGNNGDVLLQLFSTRSNLIELNSVTAGTGATFQQINTPVLNRKKFSQNFRVRNGETLIIVSNASEGWGSKDRQGLTGASTSASRSKVLSVLMVTPRVMGI